MTSNSTWLEVALNGPWSREVQPGIPIAVREIVDQGVAGASPLDLRSASLETANPCDDAVKM